MHVQTTAAMLKKPTKSIEQQRLDALKYAEKLWGPNIGKLSPSPSPSKVLSPSPPLPLPHNSSNSSSVKETTVPTRSSHITPPLPLHPAAAMRIDRKREASTSPSPHTSLEARTTGEPLQEFIIVLKILTTVLVMYVVRKYTVHLTTVNVLLSNLATALAAATSQLLLLLLLILSLLPESK